MRSTVPSARLMVSPPPKVPSARPLTMTASNSRATATWWLLSSVFQSEKEPAAVGISQSSSSEGVVDIQQQSVEQYGGVLPQDRLGEGGGGYRKKVIFQ